jgi:hypothetical protein
VSGGGLVEMVMPVVVFVVVNKLAGFGWAIAAASVWSVYVAVQRKRRGSPIGRFLPAVTAMVVVRGAIGIATDSEAVYFGIGIGGKVATGVVLIGSALLGKNILARYAPMIFGFDRATVANPIYGRAMDRIAWVAGIGEFASAGFDIWLFNNSSVNGYVLIRFLVNWPLTTALMLGSMAYLARELGKIPGFAGMTELMDQQMARYDDALRERKGRPPRDTEPQ